MIKWIEPKIIELIQTTTIDCCGWTTNSHIPNNYLRNNSIWWSRHAYLLSVITSTLHYNECNSIVIWANKQNMTFGLHISCRICIISFISSSLFQRKRCESSWCLYRPEKKMRRVSSLSLRMGKKSWKVEIQIVRLFYRIYSK